MKKNVKNAGQVQRMSTCDKGEVPMMCCSWQDKGVVYFLSTMDDHDFELAAVDRRTGAEVKQVPAPPCAVAYNRGMGGVDTADQLRSVYSLRRRGRKWWLNLYYRMIDVAIVNAYCCYLSAHGSRPNPAEGLSSEEGI